MELQEKKTTTKTTQATRSAIISRTVQVTVLECYNKVFFHFSPVQM